MRSLRVTGARSGQTRMHSALEATLNVAVGYIVAVAAQIAIFPWFDVHLPLRDNLLLGAAFTVVSLARSYALRRAFNWWHLRRD